MDWRTALGGGTAAYGGLLLWAYIDCSRDSRANCGIMVHNCLGRRCRSQVYVARQLRASSGTRGICTAAMPLPPYVAGALTASGKPRGPVFGIDDAE